MSIDFPPGLDNFIAVTPDTDRLPAPVVWQRKESKEGASYRSIDPAFEPNGSVSTFLEKYAEDPDLLLNAGDVLHDDANSQVVRIGDYVVKIFKFASDTTEWERERRAGLSAVRVAVMIEVGLAQLNMDRPISVRAPHLHACFYPARTDEPPIWIMKYEPSEKEVRVMTPDMLHRLQGVLNTAVINVGGERFIETIEFGNKSANWKVQRTEEGARLIKFGSTIKPDLASQMAWKNERRIFHI